MSNKISKVYALYGVTAFFLTFLVLFPFFLLVIHIPRLRKGAYYLNKVWAWMSYAMILMPIKKVFKSPIDPKRTYVYCANHTSFMDIPSIGLTVNQFVVFMGKASLGKVPIFGYMFSRIHISVDRDSIKDSYKAFEQAKDSIRKGHSVVIFPEGNMRNPSPPSLRRFKEGAFRMAIEEQVPIIPITIPYNWKTLFAYTGQMHWQRAMMIYHKPIETIGMTIEDSSELKRRVFEVIDQEISRHTHP